jgi:hypothetical protein
MNALDNLSARRHVNRVCLAAGVPLIESGTQGYLGQVQVIGRKVRPRNSHPDTVCGVRSETHVSVSAGPLGNYRMFRM